MQGAAITDNFMLGSATVMLGPQADLFNLTEANSIGLVKNVTTKTAPGFVDLTQGTQNTVVYSVMNKNDVSLMAEVYEYTPSNIAYAVGLDGSSFDRLDVTALLDTLYAAPVGPAVVGLLVLSVDDAAEFEANDYVMVHTGVENNVMLRKLTAVDLTADTLTIDTGLPFAVGIGAKVEKVNMIPVGSKEAPPFLSCKIVGTLANGDTVPMLFPKVRIKSGLTMAFKTDNFDNIPLELEVFDLVSTDPHYAMFQALGAAKGLIVD